MIIRGRDGLRHQFYDVIRQEHVLIVIGDDVDAVCASTILTRLLAADDVSFSHSMVGNWEQLHRHLREHAEQCPAIVLINCGGTRPIDEMQIPTDSKIFVFDSRRPINLMNIYSEEQLYVMLDPDEEESLKIPKLEEVMVPPDSEESGTDEEDEVSGNREDRFAKIEKKQLQREIRRKWDKRRKDLEWAYYESTWHGMATSIYFMELAAALNRACAEFFWLAAVGLNSQWAERLISTEAYSTVCLERLRPWTSRFKPQGGPRADDVLRISFESELPLAMYSRWNLYEAMKFDEYFACATKNWTQRGDQHTKVLLSSMGLTLQETMQTFEAMDTTRRKEVCEILAKEMKSSFVSYRAHLGFSSPISAADMARAIAVKISLPPNASLNERYDSAMEVIRPFMDVNGDFIPLEKACEKYKWAMGTVWGTAVAAINQSEIIPTGPLYLHCSSKEIDNNLLESRHFLILFVRLLSHAFSCTGKGRGKKPFICAFPLGGSRKGWHLVTGIMPVNTMYDDDRQKSYIGRAFREVSKRPQMQSSMIMDYFDSDMVLVVSQDRSRFFELLEAVMEVD